jgi:hypothetical protein
MEQQIRVRLVKNASEPASRLFNEQDIIIAIRSEAANGY